MMMTHSAANDLIRGKNVLYITLEMAADVGIGQRIDMNLLDVNLDELLSLSQNEYNKKIEAINQTTKSRLVIKEYPPASASVAHFRHLLQELRIKEKFEPDVIYVDYLNLCTSSRIKAGSNYNSYTYIKAISEELRGLAVEFNLPIISATQANRSALGSSDMGLENTSESLGLPMTADFMCALIQNDDLKDVQQIMVKQLKNRYGPLVPERFTIGVDKSKMRLYDVEQSAQEDLLDGPVMDRGDVMRDEKRPDKKKFEGFH